MLVRCFIMFSTYFITYTAFVHGVSQELLFVFTSPYLILNVVSAISENRMPMIQNLTTTCSSAQPLSS